MFDIHIGVIISFDMTKQIGAAKKDPAVIMYVRIPLSLREALEEKAKRMDRPMSYVLKRALEKYLEPEAKEDPMIRPEFRR